MNKEEAELKYCPYSLNTTEGTKCLTTRCMAWKIAGKNSGYCIKVKEGFSCYQ